MLIQVNPELIRERRSMQSQHGNNGEKNKKNHLVEVLLPHMKSLAIYVSFVCFGLCVLSYNITLSQHFDWMQPESVSPPVLNPPPPAGKLKLGEVIWNWSFSSFSVRTPPPQVYWKGGTLKRLHRELQQSRDIWRAGNEPRSSAWQKVSLTTTSELLCAQVQNVAL